MRLATRSEFALADSESHDQRDTRPDTDDTDTRS